MPFHLTQQPARLREWRGIQFAHLREVQSPLPVTALVHPHADGAARAYRPLRRKFSLDRIYFQDVGNELGQFVDVLPDVGRGRFVGMAVKVLFQVQRAAPRRTNDVVHRPKLGHKPLVQRVRQVRKPRIGHRLATAGLAFRKHDGLA